MYVYPNHLLEEFLSRQGREPVLEWAFGKRLQERLQDGQEADARSRLPNASVYRASPGGFHLANILLARLAHAQDAHVTDDPLEADLFLIPFVPNGPPFREWSAEELHALREYWRVTVVESGTTPDVVWKLRPVCEQLWSSDLSAHFPYLNASTAARHVVLALDASAVLIVCMEYVPSPGWWHPSRSYASTSPASLSLLRRMQWLSHENFVPPQPYGHHSAAESTTTTAPPDSSAAESATTTAPPDSVGPERPHEAEDPEEESRPTALLQQQRRPVAPPEFGQPSEAASTARRLEAAVRFTARRSTQSLMALGPTFVPVTNVPFPSCASTVEAVWRDVDSPRQYLASFGGSLAGSSESRRLRSMVWGACNRAPAECIGSTSPQSGEAFFPAANLALAYGLKLSSHFCLEPGGFSPIRKAILDALALNCIPVLFLEPHEAAQLWPWHWGTWRENASVVVSRRRYLSGEVDLLETLRAIPAERVQHMRETIAQNVLRLTHLEEPPPEGEGLDAVDLTLAGLAAQGQAAAALR